MKRTSIEAIQQIRDDGTLALKQKLALNCLARYGPMTGQELAEACRSPGLWKRLSELERLGWVHTMGTRKCGVTRRNATVWAFGKKASETQEQKEMFA